MIYFKRLLILLFSFNLISISCDSFGQTKNGDAGQAGELLRYGVGARALGMGGAFVAIADDATACYYNPAGISQIGELNFVSMYTDLGFESSYCYLGAVVPFSFKKTNIKNIGFGFVYLGSGDFVRRDEYNNNLYDKFGFYEYAGLFSISSEKFIKNIRFSYGGNIKFFFHDNPSLNNSSSTNNWYIPFDLAFLIDPIHSNKFLKLMKIGIVIQNIVLFSNSTRPDKLPITSRIGIAFVEPKKFSIASDFQIYNLFGLGFNRVAQISIGGEYNIENIVEFIPFYLRFGINHSIYHTYFSPGFGLSIYSKDLITQIDFAYKVRNDYPQDEFAITFSLRK